MKTQKRQSSAEEAEITYTDEEKRDIERLTQTVVPLLYWYHTNARVLPWRSEVTPYRTWISEIMLQQTRVEAVIPYFERFLQELPTVAALAAAEPDRLNKLWEGLGYYSRARNLQKAAQAIMERYGGEMPGDYPSLLSLPGIGPYTAGAVASIAFGQPEPAIDGNVIRVYTRLTADGTPSDNAALKEKMRTVLRAVYPREECAAFTQAWMELGATVCIPNGAPRCDACPVAFACQAHADGCEETYPKKPQKRPRRIEEKTVFLLWRDGRVALHRRPDSGLLAGLWEFPSAEGALEAQDAADCLGQYGVSARTVQRGEDAVHVFTHIEWHMRSYAVQCDEASPNDGEIPHGTSPSSPVPLVWVLPQELTERYPVPSAFRVFRNEVCGVQKKQSRKKEKTNG